MKNNTLNILKLICSIFVILIHVTFTDNINVIIKALSRFAVPFFLILSGYFAYNSKTIEKNIIKILKITILSTLLFLVSDIIFYYIINKPSDIFTKETLKNFILYDYLKCSPHLWYLYSLIKTYIIYYFIKKINKLNILNIISIILLILGIYYYYIRSINGNIHVYEIRNTIFTSLPLFTLGSIINEYKINKKLNNKLTISLIILFTITTLIESNYYPYQDLYISTPLLSSLIFIYALNNPNKKANKLSKISEEYSLYIYIFHYYIIKIISYIIYPKVFRYYCKSHMILIPVIIISTILLSYVYKKIKEKMKVSLHFS